MKTQLKKWGSSIVITINPELLKYNRLKIGDWVELVIRKIKSPPTAEELVND